MVLGIWALAFDLCSLIFVLGVRIGKLSESKDQRSKDKAPNPICSLPRRYVIRDRLAQLKSEIGRTGTLTAKTLCCGTMETEVNRKCAEHSDPFDCPDHTVYYSTEFKEYGIIIHDGGSSYSVIRYCPWCGSNLPTSSRVTGTLEGRTTEIV